MLEQVECADVVLINKVDLVTPRQLDAVKRCIASVNPTARVLCCVRGVLEAGDVLGVGRAEVK